MTARPNGSSARLRGLLACLVALAVTSVLASGSSGAGAAALASGSSPPLVSPRAFLHGHYPVAFILCDFNDWHYEPNSIGYYQRLWTKQNPQGTYSSLADYFHDVSFGQLDMKGSKVLGWFHMNVNPETWYLSVGSVNADRVSTRWLDCVNAAEASGKVDLGAKKFKAVVVVTPYVQGTITGKGLAAEPAVKPGKTPAPETMTVNSTKGWPPAPFLMSLPSTKAFPFGENVRVSKVHGKTLTIYRGYDEGVKQLPGPFAALPPGGTAVVDSVDDFAQVGAQVVYDQQGAQLCTGPVPVPPNTFCPKIFLSPPGGAIGYEKLNLGIANLFAGDNKHGGNVSAGVGDSAHEVGHTTGFNHSRTLPSSTSDYNDCYDQMSYNACGLSGFPGEAGPPDGVIDYDAINLEFHGWIPSRAIYNLPGKGATQVTLKLHALSDPNALKHLSGPTRANGSTGTYLDAQIPAKIRIEDVSPKNVAPTVPPTCKGAGFRCATSQYYTVEYRQLYAFDRSLPLVVSGQVGAVVLHLYAPDSQNPGGNISYLVNVYPGKTTSTGGLVPLPHAAALQPGDDYADPSHHTYVGVNSFDKSSRTATVTVGNAKFTPKLHYNGALKGNSGQLVKLAATLTVDGAPVPNEPVGFALGGQSCGPALTDASGHASCELTDSLSAALGLVGSPVTASFAGDSVYNSANAKATFGGGLAPVKLPPVVVPPATTTTETAATTVTVTMPHAYAFRLSTPGEPSVLSDSANKLSVPSGSVTFDVRNPYSSILSHDFEICSTPLPTPPPKTLTLPNSCTGTTTIVLAPGSPSVTLTVDLAPGTYEYLSTVGGAVSGDAFAGMKGELVVT